jgi:hypothetical protein
MKKKRSSISTIDLYDRNLQRLMEISKFIDEDNDYPPETQNDSVFIKLLFQDIRKCSKWYINEEWRPIKAAIHNCYKLLQKGYVPENQSELENNIRILEILLKDSSLKKPNMDKISEELVQNIFDKSIKHLSQSSFDNNNNIINDNNSNNNSNNSNNSNNNIINDDNKINEIKSFKEDDKENNKYIKNYDNDVNNNISSKNELITKEKMENALNEQKIYYETKMNLMQNDIDELKKKVKELTDLVDNISNCFTKSINKENK